MGLLRRKAGLAKWRGGLRLRGLLTVVVVMLCACAGRTQSASKPATAASAATAAQGAATSTQGEATHAPLTKAQASELFRSVDEILSFASTDTGLPIVHSVKRKLITRGEVNK